MDTKNFNFIDKIVARYRLSKVLDLVEKNDLILDFGCGTHSFLLNFSKDKIKSGIGVDYDVKNSICGNIEYRQYKFDVHLPFNNGQFDKVFMLAVLEHINEKNVPSLFEEFRRILKDEGKIVLTTPTPQSKFLLEFLAFKLKIISKEEIADHKKYYNKLDIDTLCRKTGFKVSAYRLFFGGLNSCAILEKSK